MAKSLFFLVLILIFFSALLFCFFCFVLFCSVLLSKTDRQTDIDRHRQTQRGRERERDTRLVALHCTALHCTHSLTHSPCLLVGLK